MKHALTIAFSVLSLAGTACKPVLIGNFGSLNPSQSTLSYSSNPAAYPVGSSITYNEPVNNTGAVISSYTVSPALPTGLSLNASTGVISGMPTVATPLASYTVTGTSMTGSTSTVVAISVDGPASKLVFSTQPAGSGIAGTALSQQPVVKIEDSVGNVIPSSAAVTLSLYGDSNCLTTPIALNPAATASVTGGSVSAWSGTASFLSAAITDASATLYLKAASSGVSSACSSVISVTHNAVSTAASTVSAANSSWVANGTGDLITLTLLDTYGNPVSGKTATLAAVPSTGVTIGAASGASSALGVVTFNTSSTTAETSVFTATDTTDTKTITPTSSIVFAVNATISTSVSTACAMVSGSAYCWGDNANGQIGNNSTTNVAIPTQVSGLTSGVTAISAGGYFSCAIVSGSAKCWGAGGYLGNGSGSGSNVPVQVTGHTSGVTAISCGTYHCCDVMNGAAYCWGNNGAGNLGNGTTTSAQSPVAVTGLTSGVTAISTDVEVGYGYSQSCAIMNGAAYCWGDNSAGELGNNSVVASSSTPVAVSTLTSGVTAISGGSNHDCAIMNSAAYCWGENSSLELGNGGSLPGTNSSVPVQVTGLTSGVTAISAGLGSSLAAVNGAALSWGGNAFGQLGNNTSGGGTALGVPTQVIGLTSGVTQVGSGYQFDCAVANGAAYCWGENDDGDIGNSLFNSTQYLTPITVVSWP